MMDTFKIDAVISEAWCEVEASLRTDADGTYTEIYIATDDGVPMYETHLDGHPPLRIVHAAVTELATGRSTRLTQWTDLRRSSVA